jgi:preprotein translocase subunit YajC
MRWIGWLMASTAVLAATPTPPAFAMFPGGGKGEPGGASGLGIFLPLIITFAIFYLLLIRPQQRQAKERNEMLAALKKGDSVVTAGGLHGKIVGLTEKVATLEVGESAGQKVRLKYDRSQIARLDKDTQG